MNKLYLYKSNWTHISKDDIEIFLSRKIFIDNQDFDIENSLELIHNSVFQAGTQFSISDTIKILNRLNGNFALIIKIKESLFLAADIIRSTPLFYFQIGSDFVVTDYIIKYFDENQGLLLSEDLISEFIHTGFILGGNTVFKDVYCIQAGEVVCISKKGIDTERYFKYTEDKFAEPINDNVAFTQSLDQLFSQVFSRMIRSVNRVNNWVIPLSGGHDSRIIVNYLSKLEQRNVICFSYGYPNNEESQISKRISEALGYKWYFVEYTAERWHKLHQEGALRNFLPYGFNGISSPHLQDFLALYILKQDNVIGDRDVIVPGHALDFIAGSHLQTQPKLHDKQTIISEIIKKHACYLSEKMEDRTIFDHIRECYQQLDQNLEDFPECFNWQERQTKFIVNSVRSYEYLGFDWVLPFWDRELVEFWLKVRRANKIGRSSYMYAEKNGILQDTILNIPFAEERYKKRKSFNLVQIIKCFIPVRIKTLLLRLLGKESRIHEGLNLIFSLEGDSVKDLVGPLSFYPKRIMNSLKNYLARYPYQINYQEAITLFTIKKVLTAKGYKFNDPRINNNL